MFRKVFRIVAILIGCLVLAGGGAIAGYLISEESENSGKADSTEVRTLVDEAMAAERKETTALLSDLCRAGTKLRSAYTRKTIGHSERCDSDRPGALIAAVCTDVEKAARTAHLRNGDCRGER